jgi:hypothetical protein
MKTVTSADYTTMLKMRPEYFERFVQEMYRRNDDLKEKPRGYAFK